MNRVAIPHKKVVRYLGVLVDYLLRGNLHLDAQLEKARRAFQVNCRMFHNIHLNARSKVILYMLLIRLILSYAAPIWWNSNHTMMEKMRAFERKCLRVCLKLCRSQHSDWRHYISNQTIYRIADIPRFDSFVIKQVRNYFSNVSDIDNNIINSLARKSPDRSQRQLATGYTTSQAFIFCDKAGLTQCGKHPHSLPLEKE